MRAWCRCEAGCGCVRLVTLCALSGGLARMVLKMIPLTHVTWVGHSLLTGLASVLPASSLSYPSVMISLLNASLSLSGLRFKSSSHIQDGQR